MGGAICKPPPLHLFLNTSSLTWALRWNSSLETSHFSILYMDQSNTKPLWGETIVRFFVRRDHQSTHAATLAAAAALLLLKEDLPAPPHNPVPPTRKETEYQQHLHECGPNMWHIPFVFSWTSTIKTSLGGQPFLSNATKYIPNILIFQRRASKWTFME